MKSRRGTRGAVSVFLTIILVPCIVATSLFVDLGRVHLSKGVAESSADLAMNSLLTNYDKDLQEFYGLAASCQNIDEFYDVSEDYFKRMLKSQPLTEEEKQTIVDSVLGIVKGEDVSDLLQLSSLTDSNMITPVENGSLANADILKDQIVEFMKYRAPINLVENALLSGLKENAKDLQNTQSDKNILDKQETYYTDVKDTNEQAYDLWCKVNEYSEIQYNNNTITITKEYISNMMKNLKGYKSIYKEIHRALIINLLGSEDLEAIARPVLDINNNMYKPKSLYSENKRASASKIEGALKNLGKAYDGYMEAKDVLINYFTTENPYSNNVNEIRYWQQCWDDKLQDKVKNFKAKAEDMLKKYRILVNAWEYPEEGLDMGAETVKLKISCLGGDYDSLFGKEVSFQDAYNLLVENDRGDDGVVLAEYEKYLKAGSTGFGGSDALINGLNKINEISTKEENMKAIDPEQYIVPSTNKTIANTVKDISAEMEGYYQTLDKAVKTLEEARKMADKLWKQIEKTKKSFQGWEDSITGTDTTIEGQAQKEIEDEGDKGIQSIQKEDIENFKTRLQNVINLLTPLRDYAGGTRYGNHDWYNELRYIKNYNDVKNACGVAEDTLPADKNSLENMVDSTFRFVYGKDANGNWIQNDPTDPSITEDNNPAVAQWNDLNLWKWLDGQRFSKGEVNEEKKKEFEDDKTERENLEKSGETAPTINKVENIKGGSFNGEEFPSQFKGKGVGLDDLLGNIVSLVGKLVTDFDGALAGMRDSLYVTEYIFGNFSHAVFEEEGKYEMLVADKGYDNLKNKSVDDIKSLCSSYNDAWASTDLTDQYNKSLTNRMINSENNYAYRGEIEYILSGEDAQGSLNKVYSQIFTLRLTMNAVGAFTTFWNSPMGKGANKVELNTTYNDNIYTISHAIYIATKGIVPEILSKIVLIMIEAAVETVRDMNYLMAGIPVKLIKVNADENWGNSRTTNPKNGLYLQYSDYLYIMTLIGMINDGDTAEAICLRVGDVIQANMRKVLPNNGLVVKEGSEESDGSTGYQLSKSIVYFKFNADLRVKPLMLELPFALQYDNNPKDSTGWCTFHTSIIRGYS